jgi:GntR family transcriptional regulator
MAREIDDLSGIARYLQVARAVESEIRSGALKVGNPVPSRKALAEEFGVAQMTAAKAHRWLADRGYVVAVPGVGMVITPSDHWNPDQATEAL